MKVLLVEDDVKIATAIQRGLTAEGFTVEVAFDGDDGLWRATEGVLRPLRARPDAPRPERLPDLRRAPRGGRLDADPRAHRQGRRARRGRGARHRRRRLPHQAVLVPGADRPGAGAAPPHGRARSRAGRGGRPADRPGARRAWRGDTEIVAHRPRVRRARVPRAPRRPGAEQGRDPRRRVGLRLRRRSEHRRGVHRPPPPQGRRAVRRTHSIETIRGAGYRLVEP